VSTSETSDGMVAHAQMILRSRTENVYNLLMNIPQRKLWDILFQEGKIIEHLDAAPHSGKNSNNPNSPSSPSNPGCDDLVYYVFKGVGSASPSDFTILRSSRTYQRTNLNIPNNPSSPSSPVLPKSASLRVSSNNLTLKDDAGSDKELTGMSVIASMGVECKLYIYIYIKSLSYSFVSIGYVSLYPFLSFLYI